MTPNKRLGQHFLTDRNILERIVDALDPAPGEVVLEIGPGKGSLTEALLARGLTVIAVEKDRRLAHECGVRNAEFGVERLSIVLGDALRLDWHVLIDSHPGIPHSALRTPHFKVAGNIPYNITSPLLEKALTPPLPERVVFLVQKEVADRLAAGPGSRVYGA
ncbi:MAG TPA: rRNA adenine dimethyltransferase family protein, partial [Gemmatimonadales bacterium]|nr:rRNA adenine dimethyltransferase family protein [Gemmatimonadales bacterium]